MRIILRIRQNMMRLAEKVVYTGAIDAYFDYKLGTSGVSFCAF